MITLYLNKFVCSAYWKTDEDVGAGMAGLAGDVDTHPYVSFTINLL
jgi:V-type H+-transporting ATPase subunit C